MKTKIIPHSKWERKSDFTNWSIIFQDRETAHRFWTYLESLWFTVSSAVLCSTTPQYQLHISDENVKWNRLSQAQKEIIRFYAPFMLKLD